MGPALLKPWSGLLFCVPEDKTYKAVDGRILFNLMPMNVLGRVV